MPDAILYDAAMRLFGDLVTPEISAGAERGIWPDRLWQAVEAAGYSGVLAEGAAGMLEAARADPASRNHARWLCAACGVEAPANRATISARSSRAWVGWSFRLTPPREVLARLKY